MPSSIQFLNHSSFIARDHKTKILCDPWFEGNCFDNGWSLLYEKSHDINELDFDYIWISHEHPDHFSIPTLSKLKESQKFLFQETSDKKVKKYLESKGHTVIELPDSKSIKIEELEVTSFVCDGFDSSLFIKFSDGRTLLNINDSRVDLNNEIQRIKGCINSDINLLMAQFSYANWAGNEGDQLIADHQQSLIDDKNILAIRELSPDSFMMFANFIYFSHLDNFYWNKNEKIERTFHFLKKYNENLILPSPNQIVLLDSLEKNEKNNIEALNFWKEKKNKILPRDSFKKKNTIEDLRMHYNDFLKETWNQNEKCLSKDFFLNLRIHDLNQNIQINLFKNQFELSNERYDCSISSLTFIFLMKNLFARGTITVNSKISFNYEEAHKFFLFFFIPYANNIGIFFKENDLTISKLRSIERTSVMTSIFKYYPKAYENFERDLGKYFS